MPFCAHTTPWVRLGTLSARTPPKESLTSEGLQRQAEAIADTFPDPAKRIPDHSRLSRTEEILILQLHAEGKTQTAIAQVIGCSQPTVSRVVNDYTDSRVLAKAVLHKNAQALAERVVKHANVEEALEVLERIEVVAPKRQEQRAGNVSIVIGMPGQAAGVAPVIDVSASLSPAERKGLACGNVD